MGLKNGCGFQFNKRLQNSDALVLGIKHGVGVIGFTTHMFLFL